MLSLIKDMSNPFVYFMDMSSITRVCDGSREIRVDFDIIMRYRPTNSRHHLQIDLFLVFVRRLEVKVNDIS